MDVIEVIFEDIDILDVIQTGVPVIEVVFEGEPGQQGSPGPAVNPYVYFDEGSQTWPSRPDLITVVWVGGTSSDTPPQRRQGFDLWVRDSA